MPNEVVAHIMGRRSGKFLYREVLFTFITITIIGTILLALPISSQDGKSIGIVNAFFMATSGITTTGLTVVDPGSNLTLLGQIVLLILFQLGGLGYMVFVIATVYTMQRRPSLKSGLAFRETLAGAGSLGVRSFSWLVLKITLIAEAAGTILLTLAWSHNFSLGKAIYYAFFHAVSAFSTAGFSLFSDSITSYKSSIYINITICILSIIGSVGFFVLYELGSQLSKKVNHVRLSPPSLHTRLVLLTSASLIILGTIIFYVFDTHAAATSARQDIMDALFQSISASTTNGFNTIDIGSMKAVSLFTILVLMFVGASPGSTGGGIKTTTFALMLSSLGTILKGRNYFNIFNRRVSQELINKSFVIGLIAILVICSAVLFLTVTEQVPFLNILFEATSALGTVGLSMGLTANLTIVGKITISAVMLIGRIGLLTVGYSLVGEPEVCATEIKNAETDIPIG